MKIRETMLPVLKPLGGEEEVSALREVIESGWWGKGPKVAEFEEKFAKMVGHKYAVAVTSASHGQDLVMKAKVIKGIYFVNHTIKLPWLPCHVIEPSVILGPNLARLV